MANQTNLGDIAVPMVETVYRPLAKQPSISSVLSAGWIFLKTWDRNKLVNEKVRVMLLSASYAVLGVYELKEDVDAISENPKNIVLAALRDNASTICIARYHCSQNLQPDKFDDKLLKKVQKIGNILKIDIWDYVIITNDGFFSYRKEKLLENNLLNSQPKLQNNLTEDFWGPLFKDVTTNGVSDNDHTYLEKDFQSQTQCTNKTKRYEPMMPTTHHQPSAIEVNDVLIDKILRLLIQNVSCFPSLLTGPIRKLKIMSAFRSYTSWDENWKDVYKKTSRIYMVGNWIARAGFICHEPIRVITMNRLLIVVPVEN